MTTPHNATPTLSVVVVPAVEVEVPLLDLEDAHFTVWQLEQELVWVDARRLAPMDTDVVVAASTVLSHMPIILGFRDDIVAMPGFEARNVDNLSDYAKATWFTYFASQPAPSSIEEASVAAEVARRRIMLLTLARVCAFDGVVDPAAVAKIRDGSGHGDAAGDLVGLVQLFREHWGHIHGHIVITAEDLERAARLAAVAMAMNQRRENLPAVIHGQAALRARRAWTLLDRAYGEVRRALDYLCHADGDADLIAPNLRRNREAFQASRKAETRRP